jgi:membrane protein insertase Oxa1/YidC/SpoIIIJ
LVGDALLSLHSLSSSLLPAVVSSSYIPPIVLLSLSVRFLSLPLVYLGLREGSKLSRVVPDVQFLHSLYKRKLAELPLTDTQARADASRAFVRGARGIMRVKRFNPLLLLASPLVQIPAFLYVGSEMREVAGYRRTQALEDAIGSAPEDAASAAADADADAALSALSTALEEGGALWFPDLTLADPNFVLPAATAGLMYLSLELGFSSGASAPVAKSNIVGGIQSFLQQVTILALPLTATIPASMQVYLLTSVSWSLLQMPLTRTDWARSAMGLPLLGAPPPQPTLPAEHLRMLKERAEKDREGAKEKARTILKGYKPGAGVLAPGEHTVRTGRRIESTIEHVPAGVMEMANNPTEEMLETGRARGVAAAAEPLVLPDDMLFSTRPKKEKRKPGKGKGKAKQKKK